MTLLGRELGEIDALVTDRYLDSLLAGRERPGPVAMPAGRRSRRRHVRPGSPADDDPTVSIDAAVRIVSRRLAGDLPRFHPSFRFEERLAIRLAETAASMRLALAAGAEREAPAIPVPLSPGAIDPLALPVDDEGLAAAEPADPRPFLVGGAVAASALSLAGAAWLAWRRRGTSSTMARAVRAAHEARG
jgi:hypothetical protein